MKYVRRALLLLVVVLLLAEYGGRFTVERVAEERLRDAGIAGGVDVVLGSAWWRPSLLPALAGANLDRVEVNLRDASVYGMQVELADYVLEDLEVAVSPRQRTIGASGVGEGRFRLLVDPVDIGAYLNIRTEVDGGRLLLGDSRVPAELAVDGDDLVVVSSAFAEQGGSMRLPLIDPSLLPCRPHVRIVTDLVELRCSGDDLPGILRSPLGAGRVSGGDVIDPDLPPPPVHLEPPATTQVEGDG